MVMKTSMKLKLLFQYLSQKVTFASLVTLQKYRSGEITSKDLWATTIMRNIFTREMIYLYRYKGLEMEPAVSPKDTLVVRKLPYLNARFKQYHQELNVGDVVVLKDPMNSDNHVVRRLAAVEGYEMASTNEDDEPFVIGPGQGWVLSDNKSLQSKESTDSRTYGPISMSDILGRVTYRFRTHNDKGLVVNNEVSMKYDLPALLVELDAEEMQRFADKDEQTKSS